MATAQKHSSPQMKIVPGRIGVHGDRQRRNVHEDIQRRYMGVEMVHEQRFQYEHHWINSQAFSEGEGEGQSVTDNLSLGLKRGLPRRYRHEASLNDRANSVNSFYSY